MRGPGLGLIVGFVCCDSEQGISVGFLMHTLMLVLALVLEHYLNLSIAEALN